MGYHDTGVTPPGLKYNLTTNTTDLLIPCGTLQEDLTTASKILETYIMPFLIVGIPANILVFIIFSRGGLSKIANSVIFRLLAIFDGTAVFINVVLHDIPVLLGESVITQSDGTCKGVLYIYFVSRSMSSWALVIIGLERALGVSLPHKFRDFCTRQRFAMIIAVVLAVISILYFPLLISIKMEYYPPSDTELCILHADLPDYANGFFFYAEFIISTLLPMVAMLITDVIIICVLRQSHKMDSKHHKNDKTMNRIIPLLLTASVAFIILRLPQATYMFMELTYRSRPYSCMYHVALFVGYVAYFCDTLNHSINMFLYCVSGKNFRNEFAALCKCKPCCQRISGENIPLQMRAISTRISQEQLYNTKTQTTNFHDLSVTE